MKIFVALALLMFANPTLAADPVQIWKVDPAASNITFSGKHAGKDFSGAFKKWQAEIAFDPDRLADSSAVVTIETASASTGDKTYDGSLPGADWFNQKAFPTATFKTKSIRKTAKNTYIADGILTIRDVTRDVSFPFDLTFAGDTVLMKGTLKLDRLAFNLGKTADPSAEWVSKDINVNIVVKAAKAL